MEAYKQEFIEFMVESDVLKFGDFTLKSGRKSPFFMNAGARPCRKGGLMEAYKQEFIEFMVESDVLKFGDFTLKSGRKSPFFMNAGAYVTGEQLMRLGEYYARAIHDNFGLDFDVVFGPAYKGIPLSVVTAIAMHKLYGKEVRYCSDRKEVKDHGADKGGMLGYELKDGDRVVMVEDVTTSGKSIDETYPKHAGLRAQGRRPRGDGRGRDHVRQVHRRDLPQAHERRERRGQGPHRLP